jgi:type IV secretion system protein VirB5
MTSKWLTSVAVTLFLATSFFAPRSNAQFVVDAPLADAQLVTANVSLATQIAIATKTAASAAETVSKLNDVKDAIGSGITEFGNLSFQPDDSLPGNAKASLNLMSSTGAASDMARSIQKDNSSTSQSFFSKVNPFAKGNMSADLDSAASSMAASEDIYENAVKHSARLEALRARIATATSLKDAADLTARIQLETADITNELVKAQALEHMEEHSDKVREIQTKQKMFGRNSRSY